MAELMNAWQCIPPLPSSSHLQLSGKFPCKVMANFLKHLLRFFIFLFCFKLRASLSALSSQLYLVDLPIVLVREQRLGSLIDQLRVTFGEGNESSILSPEPCSYLLS